MPAKKTQQASEFILHDELPKPVFKTIRVCPQWGCRYHDYDMSEVNERPVCPTHQQPLVQHSFMVSGGMMAMELKHMQS